MSLYIYIYIYTYIYVVCIIHSATNNIIFINIMYIYICGTNVAFTNSYQTTGIGTWKHLKSTFNGLFVQFLCRVIFMYLSILKLNCTVCTSPYCLPRSWIIITTTNNNDDNHDNNSKNNDNDNNNQGHEGLNWNWIALYCLLKFYVSNWNIEFELYSSYISVLSTEVMKLNYYLSLLVLLLLLLLLVVVVLLILKT